MQRDVSGPFISDKRYYIDKDGNIVGEDSPKRVTLLVAEGGRISAEQAKRYGLISEEQAAGAGATPPTTMETRTEATKTALFPPRDAPGLASEVKDVTRGAVTAEEMERQREEERVRVEEEERQRAAGPAQPAGQKAAATAPPETKAVRQGGKVEDKGLFSGKDGGKEPTKP